MRDAHPLLFLALSGIGFVAVICTIGIHAPPLAATASLIRRQTKLARLGFHLAQELGIVTIADRRSLIDFR